MNKKLIAILTLAVFMLTLMPMGAFAASQVEVRSQGLQRTITSTGTYQTASIVIDDTGTGKGGNLASGGSITLRLPSGLKWDNPTIATSPSIAVNVVNPTERTMTLVITSGATIGGSQQGSITVTGNIKVDTKGTGSIDVAVNGTDTGLIDSVVPIARFVDGNLDFSMIASPTRGSGQVSFGRIEIRENAPGTISSGETIRMKLPNNFTWTIDPQPTYVNGPAFASITRTEANRTAVFTFSAAQENFAGTLIFEIPTAISVGTDANVGDVEVSLGGTADGTTGTLVIGKYADYGVTVSAAASKTLIAGRENREIANVTIKEDVAGTLFAARTVRFSLPSGVEFASGSTPVLARRAGDGFASGAAATPNTAMTENRSRVEFTLPPGPLTTSVAEFRLQDVRVIVKANAQPGDIMMTVDGRAGAQGEVKVAEVIRPISFEMTASDIEIGRQSQAVNDFYIIENARERFRNGVMDLTLPANATWAATPKVEVVEGNVNVDDVTRTGSNSIVRITFDGESTVPSKLKVSGVRITTNRTVAEGSLQFTVGGSSVLDGAAGIGTNLGSQTVATVVTPAVDGTVKPVVMTVGSTVYTVDGVEMTMDVAPYVKTGRTFFPVRFVASAVGIGNDNVVWDGAQRTVTIFRANRIVQVTIDSTTMLVNGIPLTMDVAPEITAGRTMLPIRWVAQGLGVNVDWDGATQTVTLN